MRWFLILFLMMVVALFGNGAYFFKDVVIYETEVEDGSILPEGVEVLSTDAERWWIEENRLDWNEIVRKVKLELVDSLPKGFYSLVNVNPPVFKSEKDYYVFIASSQKWFKFDPGELNFGRILRAPGVSEAILVSPGTWKARYTFVDEKDLTLEVFVRSPIVKEADVVLITGNFRKTRRPTPILKSTRFMGVESLAMEVERVYERKVYRIGSVSGVDKGVWKKVFEGFVSSVERLYTFSFNVGSGNVDRARTRLVLEIENTAQNGLGFPLPDGEVVIFKTIGTEKIPVGTYTVEGANEGGTWRIIEDETNDVVVSVKTLSSRKTLSGYLRKIRVEIENYKEDSVKVRITVLGRMLKITDSDITPSDETANVVVFEMDVEPGVESFDFEVESRW